MTTPTHPNQVRDNHLWLEYSSTKAMVQWQKLADNHHKVYFWLRQGAFTWTLKDAGTTKSEKEARRQFNTFRDFIQQYY